MKTKNMKKIGIALIGILLVLPMTIWAQMGMGSHGKDQEKIEAQRIAYITAKLDLSPAEAEKFWPVYNQHHKQIKEMTAEFRKKMDFKPEDIAALSDLEADELLKTRLTNEGLMFQARQEYLLSLKEVLPTQKILLLLNAEKGFRMEMMRTASKRHPREQRR